jgi:hypothetical protein
LGLLDFFFKKTNQDIRNVVSNSVSAAVRALPRDGKQTRARWEEQFVWYEGLIKRRDYRTKEVMENLKIIRDLNPDASMAIWNFLRLANTGHTVEARTPQGRPEKAATDLLNYYAGRVGRLYGGGLDQLINVLLLTAFTQGAIALEVELTEDLSDIVDFHAVDPSTLDFMRNKETGEIELVQKQWDGQYKVLNQETVFYYPIDPDIADPHGRSPILPILQIVFFQIEVLKDIRKVIHHQGYERFDIKIMEEAILENLPDHIKRGSPEEVQQYVTGYVAEIQRQMETLEPDDDFYHTSSVEITTVGGANKSSLNVDRVIDVINQQIVTALKQLPILLGRNEGTTETHGTVQWQIYANGIESIQRGIKRLLERAYNIVLQINGKQRSAHIEFNELRVNDRQTEANAEKTETETKILQVNQGWIDNNEAALDMVGHNAVSEPIQRTSALDDLRPTTTNSRGLTGPKFRADDQEPDEFIADIDEEWAQEAAVMASEASDKFSQLLERQARLYIQRLEDAGDIPTRILLNSFRTARDEPSEEFETWVRVNVLPDSEEQMSLWDELGFDWISQAAYLVGTMAFNEFGLDVDFNRRDEQLMRWLSNRSRRSASLIQGVTDSEVIMELWDVVVEGHFTIDKMAKCIQESHAFSKSRARTIARTEVISAGRSGQYHADVQSGMVIGKKWMAAQQDRTRKGHRGADGQVVALEEPFLVANENGQLEPLLFPGDSSMGASAGNTINCRCWYKRILEGEELE